MGVITIPTVVATDIVLASQWSGMKSAIETEFNNNIQRVNLKDGWVKRPLHRFWYKLTAAGTSVNLDFPLPTGNDMNDCRVFGVDFNRSVTALARALSVKRYTLATGVDADVKAAVAIAAGTTSGLSLFAQSAVVPGTYGLRVTYSVPVGTFDAEEWLNVQVWIAAQTAALTEV